MSIYVNRKSHSIVSRPQYIPTHIFFWQSWFACILQNYLTIWKKKKIIITANVEFETFLATKNIVGRMNNNDFN
jgi:hypothetical protein